jgi:hypothetical protein
MSGSGIGFTVLIAALIAFGLYRRVRRNIGRQRMTPKRFILRICTLSIVGIVLFVSLLSAFKVFELAEVFVGLVAGAVVAFFGIRLTEFGMDEDGPYYAPNSYLGLGGVGAPGRPHCLWLTPRVGQSGFWSRDRRDGPEPSGRFPGRVRPRHERAALHLHRLLRRLLHRGTPPLQKHSVPILGYRRGASSSPCSSPRVLRSPKAEKSSSRRPPFLRAPNNSHARPRAMPYTANSRKTSP